MENKKLSKTIERIAVYKNPVELVNNLYGCHPTTKRKNCYEKRGTDYFDYIYGNL